MTVSIADTRTSYCAIKDSAGSWVGTGNTAFFNLGVLRRDPVTKLGFKLSFACSVIGVVVADL
jgi:hypothetical protein